MTSGWSVAIKATSCKKCGEHIQFIGPMPCNPDGSRHTCYAKVKIYTEEEKRELEKQRKKGK